MIGRKTAKALGEGYSVYFSHPVKFAGEWNDHVSRDELYDFLYANDYEAWFCNLARKPERPRELMELIMKLHTGETLVDSTAQWSWDQREKLGQRYLHGLAEDFLNLYDGGMSEFRQKKVSSAGTSLRNSLELDGYVRRDNRLMLPERDVINAEEEIEILEGLYISLGLANRETALHHLARSEETYVAGNWDDSISNGRKYLESVLREVAAIHSSTIRSKPIAKSTYESPGKIRKYLETEGLLEAREAKTLANTYGLLSSTGSHPYMARNDQARLLRHLALTWSQFAMLRLEGRLAAP